MMPIPVICAFLVGASFGGQNPAQDPTGIETLIRQLGANRIEEREDASLRLVALGKAARPAVVRAIQDADAGRAAAARSVLDRIDRLPECLLDSLARSVTAHGADYQRLLRDLSIWFAETCEKKDWGPFEAALKAAGCERTESWLREGPERLKGREASHRYVLIKDGFTTPGGLKHELYAQFHIQIHVEASKRTRFEIRSTEIGLSIRFGEPLAEVQRRAPFPRDSVLDCLLRTKDEYLSAMNLPILDSIEVHYGVIHDRSIAEQARGFHLRMKKRSENDDQWFSGSFTASSGLDPLLRPDGTPALEGFKPENTLGKLHGRGGHGGGPSFSDWKFLRKGHQVPKGPPEVETTGPTAYSIPDIDALPAETRELIIDMPELRDEELVHVKRLKALKYLGVVYCEKLTGAGLEHVATIEGLAGLVLSGERLEDDGLKHLSRVPTLQQLTIYDAFRLTQAGFRHLGQIRSLRFLRLYGCRKLTDTCIEELASLPNLKELELAGPHESFGDWGPRPLARIESLERIEVWRPGRVSAADLAALARMPILREVLFFESPLTDSVLGELGASQAIESIIMRGSREITAAGLKKLLEMARLNQFVANECPRLLKEEMRKVGEGFKGEFLLESPALRSRRK